MTECTIADEAKLRRQLKRLGTNPSSEKLTRLIEQSERATERLAERRRARPKLDYPPELPVSERRDEIAEAIRDHPVVILCGETGSGKTTQLPKICLELGRGRRGMIGHTQPRRIAARSVADRVASEMGARVGGVVGAKVRFGDQTGSDTLVKLMTDGILLAETQGDRRLYQYDTIIIDEAHERSLNIDFLLGYLRRLLEVRRDLKVIVTSATIDPERFAAHFALPDEAGVVRPAPIIEVSGRTYPVEIRYRPRVGREDEDLSMVDAIVEAADECAASGHGDALIFLSGEREIRIAARELRKAHPEAGRGQELEIVPLYARLSTAEQRKVFAPHRGRRIVLATNVAETSLTVPGIRYVIDTGEARISRYSPRTRIQRLPIEAISQASANQRAGRCGRIGPGVCIRLFGEDDYLQRDEFTPPEILRTNLASAILRMKSLKLGAVEDFPFIDAPDGRMIRDGIDTLTELGAMNETNELTDLGWKLAKLPVDPRVGRLVIAGDEEGCLHEALVLASALSIQDPRERPAEQQDAADEAHAQFVHEDSDFLGLIKLWGFYHEQKAKLSSSRLRKACTQNFLSFMRMREWSDTYRQLKDLARELGLREGPELGVNIDAEHESYERIHTALLTGLLTGIGHRAREKSSEHKSSEYKGVHSTRFAIHPSSGLFKSRPKWIMAGELVRTTKLWARLCARIQPEWAERVAGDLVKRSHTNPRWDKDRGRVMADEKVSLFGLDLAPKRMVHFGGVDPERSRELFILHGLVEGEAATRHGFLAHNESLVEQVRELEARKRQADLLVEKERIFEFYDRRLGDEVCTTQRLDRWVKRTSAEDERTLYMTRDDLIRDDGRLGSLDDFPDVIDVGGRSLPLDYRMEHGADDDGVTVIAPVDAITIIDERRMEWLVPGLARDKIVELIRGLPKAYRRLFGPASAFAEELLGSVEFAEDDLISVMTDRAQRETGETIPRDAWRRDALPAHLRMHYRVVDRDGEVVAHGRDLHAIRRTIGAEMRGRLAGVDRHEWIREGLTDWTFGEVPERVEVERGGLKLLGYPAVIDQGEAVGLRLMESSHVRDEAMRRGLRRLFMLHLHEEMKYRAEHIPGIERLGLQYTTVGSIDELKWEIVTLVADRAFIGEWPFVRTGAMFEVRLDDGWKRLGDATGEVLSVVEPLLAEYQAVAHGLAADLPPDWMPAADDARRQLAGLVTPGFLTATPWRWLTSYGRYLRAVRVRFEKLRNRGLDRDADLTREIARFEQARRTGAAFFETREGRPEALDELRWLIEEYRVQLFAQELGVAAKVSAKRLEKLWETIRSAAV
ncbi:MAG: ATP-dependent RNA helicase HrpA [Planctomycetota bacterium]